MILLNRYSRGIFSILLVGYLSLNAEEVTLLYENDNEPLFQNSSNEFISQSAQIIAKLNVGSDKGELIIFQDGFPKTNIAQDEQRMTTLKLNPGENRIDIDFKNPLIKRSRYRLFYLPDIEINSANFIIQGSSDLETNREIELSKNLSTAVNIPNIQLKLNRLPKHIDHSLIVYDTFNNPLPISENESFHVVNLELKRGPNDFKIISRIKNQIIDEETVSLFLQNAVEILPELKKSSRLERTHN